MKQPLTNYNVRGDGIQYPHWWEPPTSNRGYTPPRISWYHLLPWWLEGYEFGERCIVFCHSYLCVVHIPMEHIVNFHIEWIFVGVNDPVGTRRKVRSSPKPRTFENYARSRGFHHIPFSTITQRAIFGGIHFLAFFHPLYLGRGDDIHIIWNLLIHGFSVLEWIKIGDHRSGLPERFYWV